MGVILLYSTFLHERKYSFWGRWSSIHIKKNTSSNRISWGTSVWRHVMSSLPSHEEKADRSAIVFESNM